ncbi:MAG TPA: hypothetical protein VNN55_03370, partial [bacterium]|nr:hypothetical protein [bacterium]
METPLGLTGSRRLIALALAVLSWLCVAGCPDFTLERFWDCIRGVIPTVPPLNNKLCPGDSGGSPPPISEPDPDVDIECDGTTVVRGSAGGSASAAGRMVWAALEKDGQVFFPTGGVSVPEGPYQVTGLEVRVPSGTLPGTYNYVQVLTDGSSPVGDLTNYLAISEPKPVQIGAAGVAALDCFRVLYGDSLTLKANVTPFGAIAITDRGTGESSDPGISWQAANPNGLPSESQFFVNLG